MMIPHVDVTAPAELCAAAASTDDTDRANSPLSLSGELTGYANSPHRLSVELSEYCV